MDWLKELGSWDEVIVKYSNGTMIVESVTKVTNKALTVICMKFSKETGKAIGRYKEENRPVLLEPT